MIDKLRHGSVLLAVVALLAAGGCGSDSGSSGKKASSTPAATKSKPSGY